MIKILSQLLRKMFIEPQAAFNEQKERITEKGCDFDNVILDRKEEMWHK